MQSREREKRAVETMQRRTQEYAQQRRAAEVRSVRASRTRGRATGSGARLPRCSRGIFAAWRAQEQYTKLQTEFAQLNDLMRSIQQEHAQKLAAVDDERQQYEAKIAELKRRCARACTCAAVLGSEGGRMLIASPPHARARALPALLPAWRPPKRSAPRSAKAIARSCSGASATCSKPVRRCCSARSDTWACSLRCSPRFVSSRPSALPAKRSRRCWLHKCTRCRAHCAQQRAGWCAAWAERPAAAF